MQGVNKPVLSAVEGRSALHRISSFGAITIAPYAGYIAASWEQTLLTRYTAITDMYGQGMSPAQIARAFEFHGRYSERNIRMILAGRFEELRAVCGGEQYGIPGV